ncbi:MAG: sodium:calcium exchanger [Alteromonadaceae bacterium]|uniref:Calx-beta domain-containing protein n=1 Tax=uncultured Paraglaciecola sp. TaxID=1765024 RepID=UPI000C4F6AB4|nr:sodium:calcium exchanger [Alteromonadaceae bacterium]|tara:strand:- start:51874 stop:53796 length:1923 start_codon:yes stop_codon:yes gene_type:complete
MHSNSLFKGCVFSLILLWACVVSFTAQADSEIEILIFYQPSFFDAYGEDEGVARIESMVDTLNTAFSEQEVSAKVSLVDFTPMVNLSDSTPYDTQDEDGEDIELGADYYASLYILNDGYEENDMYQKWSPDLVVYLRDHQGEEKLNTASKGGLFSALLAQNTLIDNLIFMHNLGHNLGAEHEYEDAGDTEPEYAHAYTCAGNKTIMYSDYSDAITPYFSSPLLTLDDAICGDAEYADNLTVIKAAVSAKAELGEGVEPWGTVYFESDSYSVNENETATITIKRDGNLGAPAKFKLILTGISAKYLEDYSNAFIDVEFEIGQDNVDITLPIINDEKIEPTETLELRIAYPYLLSKGSTTEATLTIVSDEASSPPGEISLQQSEYSVNEGDPLTIKLARNNGDSGSIEVLLTTQDDTAKSDVDYTSLSEKILFADGQTSANITLFTFNDDTYSEPKNLTLSLTSEDSRHIGVSEAVVTITNTNEPFIGNFLLEATIDVESEVLIYTISRSQNDAIPVGGTVLLTIGSRTHDFEFNISQTNTEITGEFPITNTDFTEAGTATLEIFITGVSQAKNTVNFEAKTDIDSDTNDDSDSEQENPNVISDSGGGAIGPLGLIGLMLLSGILRHFSTPQGNKSDSNQGT